MRDRNIMRCFFVMVIVVLCVGLFGAEARAKSDAEWEADRVRELKAKATGTFFIDGGTLYYQGSEYDDEVALLYYEGTASELDIPGAMDGKVPVLIGSYAFMNNSLKTVTVPDSINRIEDNAFYCCEKLETVRISPMTEFFGIDFVSDCENFKAVMAYSNSPGYFYAKEYGYTVNSLGVYPLAVERIESEADLKKLKGAHAYTRFVFADGIYRANWYFRDLLSVTFQAEHPGKAEWLSSDNELSVLELSHCFNITVDGLILGHESISWYKNEGNCTGYWHRVPEEGDYISYDSNADVIQAWYMAGQLEVKNCDLYGCGIIATNIHMEENSEAIFQNCVLRDCQMRAVDAHISNNGSVRYEDCVFSGNAYDEKFAALCGSISVDEVYDYDTDEYTLPLSLISIDRSVFINNHNKMFASLPQTYSWEDRKAIAGEKIDISSRVSDCEFHDNVWDGGTPGAYGVCLNGLTWQAEGDIVRLGYSISTGDGGTIANKGSEVLKYSQSSLPWKKYITEKTTYDVAPGITYDREVLSGVKVETDKTDDESKDNGENGDNDGYIPVTGVRLNASSMGVKLGSTPRIYALVLPENATNQSVRWSTSDPSVVTVADDGRLTTHAVGTAIISVTTEEGNYTAACTVRVHTDDATETGTAATALVLNRTELTMAIGDTKTLGAAVVPQNAASMTVLWTSSDLSVARVDMNTGKVTAVAEGMAVITASADNGRLTAACTVTVLSDTALRSYTGWRNEGDADYWYENGIKQGTEGRGKEIYDPKSDAWYWLDADQGGAKAVSKEVYMPLESGDGKWVRYDAEGHMIKGWYYGESGVYYYDPVTGAMTKGKREIDGQTYHFDVESGLLQPEVNDGWLEKESRAYWFEQGVCQGTYGDPKGVLGDGTVRGREIYDAGTDAWYWLDANSNGARATGKEVWMPYIYQNETEWDEAGRQKIAQESDSGMSGLVYDAINAKAGKWVRYDENGKMLKGWITIEGSLAQLYPDQEGNTYYYDHQTGLMAKGDLTIEGRLYHFDRVTGVLMK